MPTQNAGAQSVLRRAGAWIVGERVAAVVGWILSFILIAAVIVIVAGIVVVGVGLIMDALHESGMEGQTQSLLSLVLLCVVTAVLIAIVPPLIRSIFGPTAVWWTNLFRLIALIVLISLVQAVAPFDSLQPFRAISGHDRSRIRASAAEPVGLIPSSPHKLPRDIAEIRRNAILEQYRRSLARLNDAALAAQYKQVKKWRPLTARYATAAGLDATKVEAVMMVESAGDPKQRSSKGAMGLMQIMPGTLRDHGAQCGAFTNGDVFDPEKNICVGTDVLRNLVFVKYPGDWENTLAAYNWGASNLDSALDHLGSKFPGNPRSFWALWDKKDPTFLGASKDSKAKRGKNPEGWLLFNYGDEPDATRHYVPSVLAWEYIIRYLDEHGRPPPRDGRREPPLLARRGAKPRPQPDEAEEWREETMEETSLVAPTSDLRSPTSGVWYTLRPGEDIGHALVLFEEPTEVIAALNPDDDAGGLVYLPEERYAFYRPSGSESYRAIALRHGMTTAELLHWAGRWNFSDVWAASRRDCPPDGCEDELELASAGEPLLVRK